MQVYPETITNLCPYIPVSHVGENSTTYLQFTLKYVWYEGLHFDNLNSRVELKSKNTPALSLRSRSVAGKWCR